MTIKTGISISLLALLVSVIVGPGQSVAATVPVITPLEQIVLESGTPARTAIGADGRVVVTDAERGHVVVYANNGLLQRVIPGFGKPLGIAVDSAGNIYVSDSAYGSVGVYSGAGEFLFKLGSGNGQFLLPNDIAVSSDGRVYVTDSKANAVKMFSSGGVLLGSFGSGLLKFPTGIAIEEGTGADGAAWGNVYVVDHKNKAVRLYSLAGSFIKTVIGAGGGGMMGGSTSSSLFRPLGIAVDSTRLYVTDAFHSSITSHDKTTGALLGRYGIYGSGPGEFRVPVDLGGDKDGKLFVTNNVNGRVEVLGVDDFTGIVLSPASMDVRMYNGGSAASQTVSISAVGHDTAWTASADVPWVILSANAGTTPGSVVVTVEPGALVPGQYSSQVKFVTPSGTEYAFRIHLVLDELPVELHVAPSSIQLVYQKASANRASESLMISSTGGSAAWTATTDADWLAFDQKSGMTPSGVRLGLSEGIRNYGVGHYETDVVVSAEKAVTSPVTVRVSVDVMEAGNITVRTNLNEASYTISGPEKLSGAGAEWNAKNVKTGTYSIVFGHVSGCRKPHARTFTVATGQETVVDASYRLNQVATHVIAGSGSVNGTRLAAMALDGSGQFSLSPFVRDKGIRVAAGDLDGDGLDEIIATDGVSVVKVFSSTGEEICLHNFGSGVNGLDIAVGDLDVDGRAELISGFILRTEEQTGRIKGDTWTDGRSAVWSRVVSIFRLEEGKLVNKQVLLSEEGTKEFTLAAGDIDGDGRNELLMADAAGLTAYDISESGQVSSAWKKGLFEKQRPFVSAGDLNDDGIDEIIWSKGPFEGSDSRITILNGDGTEFGLTIVAYEDYGYMFGATVSVGDIDGDGAAEIVAGAGPGGKNEALIRVFESDGDYVRTITAFESLNAGAGSGGADEALIKKPGWNYVPPVIRTFENGVYVGLGRLVVK